jgi:hypothetical protein
LAVRGELADTRAAKSLRLAAKHLEEAANIPVRVGFRCNKPVSRCQMYAVLIMDSLNNSITCNTHADVKQAALLLISVSYIANHCHAPEPNY